MGKGKGKREGHSDPLAEDLRCLPQELSTGTSEFEMELLETVWIQQIHSLIHLCYTYWGPIIHTADGEPSPGNVDGDKADRSLEGKAAMRVSEGIHPG